LAVIFGEGLFLETRRIGTRANFFSSAPNCFCFLRPCCHGYIPLTSSNAFDSIWHSALFHQLIALNFLFSNVVDIYSFLSDRWAEIISCVAGSCSFFDILQLFFLFSLFVLFIDDLTETFATGTNSSYTDTSLFGPLLQIHSRSWKNYKKPSYLHRHRIKHSVFTRNLFEIQTVHQVGHPSTTRNLFSTSFPIKFLSCNFRPNQSLA